MIAHVVPYTRTIRGKEYFDYRIPEDLSVKVGDIVEVMFRSKKLFGLVWAVQETSEAKRLKDVVAVYPYVEWQDPHRRALLQWFAQYYAISLPTAFKTMQFPLLRRPRKSIALAPLSHDRQTEGEKFLKKSSQLWGQIIPGKTHLVRFDRREDCLRLYSECIAQIRGHLLIIVPEQAEAATLPMAIGVGQRVVHTVTSQTSPSQWHAVIQALRSSSTEPIICIGTKRSVFLPLHLFDVVIVDSEESRSHKQYELNPRYHVRTVVEWLAQQKALDEQPTVIFTSQSPSIDCFVHAQERGYVQRELSPRIQQERTPALVVDMANERTNRNYSWFSEPLVEAVRTSKKSLLFLNRVGFYGSALCKDCNTLLPSTATTCRKCRGNHIQYMRKGTAQLERELRLLFPDKHILRVDRDQQLETISDIEIRKADIIIGTEKIFGVLPLSSFDCIGVLSVDHLLVYPHFRSHERVYQLLVRLCSADVPVVIQTSAPHHPVIRAAVQHNYTAFAEQEIAIRRLLHLPPFGERIVVLNTVTGQSRQVNAVPPLESLEPDTVIDRQ